MTRAAVLRRVAADLNALVDAGRLEELPDFDRRRYAAWKKRLRVS